MARVKEDNHLPRVFVILAAGRRAVLSDRQRRICRAPRQVSGRGCESSWAGDWRSPRAIQVLRYGQVHCRSLGGGDLKKLFARMWNRFHELIVYCIIGCTGATLDFLIYALLTKGCILHYQLSNLISVSFGIVNNFFWNYHFNFKVKDHLWQRLGSFYCVGMFGWALSAGCLWFLIERSGMNSLVSKLCTIVVVTVTQFCLNKFITFRKRGVK